MVGHTLKVIQEGVLMSWFLLWETRVHSSKDPLLSHSECILEMSFFKIFWCWGMYLPIPTLRCLRTALGVCGGREGIFFPLNFCTVVAEALPKIVILPKSPVSEKQSCLLPWSGSVHHRYSWTQRLANRVWCMTPHASTNVSNSDLTPIVSNSS